MSIFKAESHSLGTGFFDGSRLLQKNIKQVTWRPVAPSTGSKEFPFSLIQKSFHQELIHFISVHNHFQTT